MKLLSILLSVVVLLLSSCASFTTATGIGRKAPVSVAAQGPAEAFAWSVLVAPDAWDKSCNPLDRMEPATPLLVRGSPTYWRNAFDPSYH